MRSDEQDKQLGLALGRIPSGLFIITVAHDGVESGLLASWVQQCSFEPPMVSLAVKPNRPIAHLLVKGSFLTLNLLEEGQTDMIVHFGRGFALDDDPFAGLDVERGGAGGPILLEALAVLECQVLERVAAGDHELFLAQVTAGRVSEGRPMVHVRKNGFHY